MRWERLIALTIKKRPSPQSGNWQHIQGLPNQELPTGMGITDFSHPPLRMSGFTKDIKDLS